jgi:hypothetical protein
MACKVLQRCGPAPFHRWARLWLQELGSCIAARPLLSGPYRLLKELMGLLLLGERQGLQQPQRPGEAGAAGEEEERTVLWHALAELLQEVLVACRRYKVGPRAL